MENVNILAPIIVSVVAIIIGMLLACKPEKHNFDLWREICRK